MRRNQIPLSVTALGVLALSAGCGSGTSGVGDLPPSAQSIVSQLLNPQNNTPDPNLPCVVGHWSGVAYQLDEIGRGEGMGNFRLAIEADGHAEADFSGMAPITIRAYSQQPGTTSSSYRALLSSEMTYSGKATGKMKLPPTGALKGAWEPESGIDWAAVHLTLTTEGERVFTDVPVSDLTGDGGVPGAGNTQPLLGAGKFICAETRMTVEQQLGRSRVTWEFLRR